MLRMIYRVSKSAIASQGRPSGDVTATRVDFQGDEIALDKTARKLDRGSSLCPTTTSSCLDRRKEKTVLQS